jgi:tRNA pseudouridine55 synthase
LNGFLNILKPPGMTSHDVVNFVRKHLHIKKVGHLGTLDPGAAGVLPICIGKATKLSNYMMEHKKSYRAEITFGFSTDTLDKYGNILHVTKVHNLNENELINVINSFRGNTKQIPPMYSAKKVKGKKLYEYAKEGKIIERNKINITIYDIKIVSYVNLYRLMLDIECSKGTYIRTLVHDICKKLSMAGYMSLLIRTAVGPFKIEDSITIEEIKNKNFKLIDIDSVLDMPLIFLNDVDSYKIKHGQIIMNKYNINNLPNVKLYDNNKNLIGIGRVNDNKISIERLLVGVEE